MTAASPESKKLSYISTPAFRSLHPLGFLFICLYVCYMCVRACVGQFYVNLTQTRVILENGTSFEKVSPLDWIMGKPAVHFIN